MERQISSLIHENVAIPPKCPHCHSLYINDLKCEQCGSYFRIDGPKSFYDIKDDYIESLSTLKRLLLLLKKDKSSDYRNFIFKLKKRGVHLLKTFKKVDEQITYFEPDEKNRYLNFLELKSLIKEINHHEESLDIFYNQLNDMDSELYIKNIARLIFDLPKPLPKWKMDLTSREGRLAKLIGITSFGLLTLILIFLQLN